MKLTLFLLAFCPVLCLAADTAWDTAASEPARIAVPKGWRSMDGIKPTMPLFRQGDGLGVPAVDETGAPLQIGLTVERFPAAEQSTDTIARELAKGATRDRRLEMVGKETVEPVKLSDQTEATLVTSEFIKSGTRRSLQMKLIGKDAAGQVWIASGFLVGGKDSKWPTPNSKLAAWLRAHVTSLTLTDKDLDRQSLETAYQLRDADK